MRNNTLLKVFLCLLAIVFVGHQVYSSVYKPITTVTAEYYEDVDGLTVTGVIIREETHVSGETGGALHFVTQDGSRVAKGGVIADIYQSADASVTVSKISELQKSIDDIEEMQSYNDVQAADLSLANNKVKNALNELVRSTADGNFSNANDDSGALLNSLNRRQLITGEQTDFSAQLAALNEQLATLKSTLPAAIGNIRAQSSGYFVSASDGYETVLSGLDTTEITPEFLDSMSPGEVPQDAIGKIVSDYEWYIAAKVDINESLKYKEGDTLVARTMLKSTPELSVKVERINISAAGDNAAIVLSCQQMNSELATMRTGIMTLVSKTYTGLKIPRKSLRVVDGKTGVYVLSGITLKFVEVEVIFSGDDYIICSQEKSNESVLRLYDEVVLKGKKLYDGKIVG